jgi:hypothetical protein
MPILAEKAVEGAAFVKDRQVVFTPLAASPAYGCGDAISRQRISVPVEKASFRRAGEMPQPTFANGAQATEASFPFPDNALAAAQGALHPFPPSWWCFRQIKQLSRPGMDSPRLWKPGLSAGAIRTHSQHLGHQ